MRARAGQYQIYVIKSEDDGDTWTDDTRISTYAGMAGYGQLYPAIAVDSRDNLHVVWEGRAVAPYNNFNQIWYALYDTEWRTPIRMSTYAGMDTVDNQAVATIAVDSSDNLHVLWDGKATGFAQDQIWYNVYTNSWAGPIRISDPLDLINMDSYPQFYPSIAVDSEDNLHVVWRGKATGFTTDNQIWYAKGVPPYTATEWVTPIRISDALNMALNPQTYPCIAIDSNNNLHVVWMGQATGFANYQIWYATAVPPHAAANWVAPARISDPDDLINMDNYHQYSPSIAVDSSDYLHVVWHGKATGYLAQNVVWYAVYVISWATPECIQPTGRNQYPSLRWSRWPR